MPIGFYVPSPIVEEHQSELKGYETTKATIRFPLDQKLPLALIKKLVKARVRKNEEADKKKELLQKAVKACGVPHEKPLQLFYRHGLPNKLLIPEWLEIRYT